MAENNGLQAVGAGEDVLHGEQDRRQERYIYNIYDKYTRFLCIFLCTIYILTIESYIDSLIWIEIHLTLLKSILTN